MKRNFIILLLLLLTFSFGNAQNESYRKPVIFVNYFNHTNDIRDIECDLARTGILTALSDYPRIRVVDIAMDASISEETKRRMREEALGDELARSGEMKLLGADYILEGNISNIVIEKKKNDEGKITYNGTVTYTIKIVSTEDGTVAFSDTYTVSETNAESTDVARSKSLKKVSVGCGLIETVFPLTGHIIDTDYTIKKNKMKTCYINLGSQHGIQADQYLDVKKVKYVAGRAVYENIGVLRVSNVLAEDLSECNITRNGKEILEAMKEYLLLKTESPESAKPLSISSRCDSGSLWTDLRDAGGDLINSFK